MQMFVFHVASERLPPLVFSPTNFTHVDVISVHSLVLSNILLGCKALPTGGTGMDGDPIVEMSVGVAMVFAGKPHLTNGT